MSNNDKDWGSGEIGTLRRKLGQARGMLANSIVDIECGEQINRVDLERIKEILDQTAHPIISEKEKSIQPLKKLAKKYRSLVAPNPKGHDLTAIENTGFDIIDWVRDNL